MNRSLKALLLILLPVVMLSSYAAPTDIYPFDQPKQAAQFHALLKELRCLVCQNQDLADSNASLAQDLRREVYRMVKDGQSDQDIMRYLTTRYGDFILFKPPIKSLTLLLWLGPGLFLLLGCFIFLRSIRWQRGGHHG